VGYGIPQEAQGDHHRHARKASARLQTNSAGSPSKPAAITDGRTLAAARDRRLTKGRGAWRHDLAPSPADVVRSTGFTSAYSGRATTAPVEWTPERVEADTAFAEGERIRLSIESPRDGYLY
jgi:hypothetical protein